MKKTVDTAELLPPFEDLFNPTTMSSMVLRAEAQALVKQIGEGENLFIFVGSSGAGRDTILEECLRQIGNSVRLRRTTTRKPREQVKDQERMRFITEKAFLNDFKKGEILFAGRYKANNQLYGISRGEIIKLKDGKAPHLLEENFSGLPLKMLFPKSKLIVVLPPTADVLKDRLFSRDKSEEECLRRFETSISETKAVLANIDEMVKCGLLDMVVVNEGFPEEVGKRVEKAMKEGKKLVEDYSKLEKSLRNYSK